MLKKDMSNYEAFSWKDIVLITVFMGLFAILAFYRLGSTVAPQTYIEFGDGETGNDELILNFDKEVHIWDIYFFMGIEAHRVFSFSSYDYEKNEWKVIASKVPMGETLTWSALILDEDVRSLGIVSMNTKAYVNEIIIFDDKGNRVLPANADKYKELFDEQDLFESYVTYYDQTFFDEIFHARTAYEFVHKLPVYETSHPPLGKLLISIGIRLFGMTPFGWRFIPALFGIMLVPVIYLFAWVLTRQRKMAIFATFLFDCEFMHLVMSRIATLDIIIAFFVLLMFLLMYEALRALRNNDDRRGYILLFFCGISTACAVATKWTGAYAAVGIAVCFLGWFLREYPGIRQFRCEGKRIAGLAAVCIVSFVVIPAVIYCLAYIPYTWETGKNVVAIAIDNSRHMLTHHSNDIFDHPYSSKWYEWPIDKQPMVYTYDFLENGKISTVVSFGNPIIWWGGLVALAYQLYLWLWRKNKSAGYLCVAYVAMLLPWLFIGRTVFIYQYFIPSIILILMLCNSFADIKKRQKECMIVFAIIALFVFVMFYPALTGQAISMQYESRLEWFKTWEIS